MFAENLNPGAEPDDRTSLDWALWRAQMALLECAAQPRATANPQHDLEGVHWIGELRRQQGGLDAGWEDESLVRSCEVWIRG